ncbi:Dabb family protein [Pseudodesulfovibrio sp. zrk46]|uniref:Dabb family protein n=1 Tax=Pseudodesulfovibrio sp. zrk46 TaxID=2725288 RepID=UPI00144972E1|nr:Dabb family protein [Pseudodesulfovibrio sp. zrk46]QJB55040.1 Dabb family protein [Pseudodesulfovibrio sp. zrk46]
MVRHIVWWTLKEEVDGVSAQENAEKMKEMLEALMGRIEGLQHIEVGYKILTDDPKVDVILCSEHDDAEALAHYATHPEHLACVEFVKTVVSSRQAIDYEI